MCEKSRRCAEMGRVGRLFVRPLYCRDQNYVHATLQTTCTLPPDNRQNAVVSQPLLRQPTAEIERAACAEIDMARRPSSRTMPLARRREPAARWRAPRSARRRCAGLHHSRTTPDSERCSSYETAHRSRAPLPCAIRSGGGPGGVLPLMGVAFPRGLPSHEPATYSYALTQSFEM